MAMLGKLGVTPGQIEALEPSTIEVCNIKNYRAHEERIYANFYIGRWEPIRLPSGMKHTNLGNPHVVAPYRCNLCRRMHERGEGAHEFGNDLTIDKRLQQAIKQLAADIVMHNAPVKLWCHCSPMACHGDVIVHRLIKHLTHLELI